MKNILKLISFVLILLVYTGCQNDKSIKSDDHIEQNEEVTSNKVTLLLTQLEVMDVELDTIKQVNLEASLKVNGQLELPPQNMASVSAIIGGRVRNVNVIEGDYVKKGQVIANLSNPEFITIQREYLTAKSNISYLEKDYNRKKELLKDGITSTKSFQQAEAAYLDARSTLNATKSTIQLMGISVSSLENGDIVPYVPVIAPIKGYVQNIEINIGKFVTPEQEMFEIVDNEYLHLGLKVFEKDIDKVKVGQKITFSLITRPDNIYEAEIFALGKAFDMETRAVKVHAKMIGNYEGLLTGMFVEARIAIDNKKVNALPNEAFINDKGLDYIFVQIEKDENDIELERVQVNKGITDLGFSEVVFKDPLPKDAIVVVKGAYYVNAELNKGDFEEHEH